VKALTKRPGVGVSAAVFACSLALFALAAIYTLRQQENINVRLCEGTVENREAVRETWNAARVLILRRQTDGKERTLTNEFFDGVLRPIPPLECVDNKPIPKGGVSE
jgi:hypothetical protein